MEIQFVEISYAGVPGPGKYIHTIRVKWVNGDNLRGCHLDPKPPLIVKAHWGISLVYLTDSSVWEVDFVTLYCQVLKRKISTFPSKTFRMELNFVLSNWPKKWKKPEKTIERPANHAEEILVWKLISYIFELYESYENKFPTKISSFTVYTSLRMVRWSVSG